MTRPKDIDINHLVTLLFAGVSEPILDSNGRFTVPVAYRNIMAAYTRSELSTPNIKLVSSENGTSILCKENPVAYFMPRYSNEETSSQSNQRAVVQMLEEILVLVPVSYDDATYLKAYPYLRFLHQMGDEMAKPSDDKERRKLARDMYITNLDSQGRIYVPDDLRARIKLQGNPKLVGNIDHFEIWDRKEHERVYHTNGNGKAA